MARASRSPSTAKAVTRFPHAAGFRRAAQAAPQDRNLFPPRILVVPRPWHPRPRPSRLWKSPGPLILVEPEGSARMNQQDFQLGTGPPRYIRIPALDAMMILSIGFRKASRHTRGLRRPPDVLRRRNRWKSGSPAIANPSRAGTNDGRKDSSRIGAISMLMTRTNGRRSGRCADGRLRCCRKRAPSASAKSTAGCRTAPTRMPANGLRNGPPGTASGGLAGRGRSPRLSTCSTPSEIPAPNVRLDRRPAPAWRRRGSFQRPSRFSTRLRALPTFLTAFFTAAADRPVFFDS